MALGRREPVQSEMWVAAKDLPRSAGHVFYGKLNRLLDEAEFDRRVEELCRPYYGDEQGRPGIAPGVYFRMLFVGFFEGLGSQRAIAWKCSDSLSVREFLGVPIGEDSPDHSSLTRIRQRLPLEVHLRGFQMVLEIARQMGVNESCKVHLRMAHAPRTFAEVVEPAPVDGPIRRHRVFSSQIAGYS